MLVRVRACVGACIKVACTEWIKVFRWIDGHEDWSQPRHTKHGLDVVRSMGADRGNQILNRCGRVALVVAVVGCGCVVFVF